MRLCRAKPASGKQRPVVGKLLAAGLEKGGFPIWESRLNGPDCSSWTVPADGAVRKGEHKKVKAQGKQLLRGILHEITHGQAADGSTAGQGRPLKIPLHRCAPPFYQNMSAVYHRFSGSQGACCINTTIVQFDGRGNSIFRISVQIFGQRLLCWLLAAFLLHRDIPQQDIQWLRLHRVLHVQHIKIMRRFIAD